MISTTAIDLFCGAGGATNGLEAVGVRVLFGLEVAPPAAATYRTNHPSVWLLERDILEVDPIRIRRTLGLAKGELAILKTCPPCQPFSSLSQLPRKTVGEALLATTRSWVEGFAPKVVMMENVPGIAHSSEFQSLCAYLKQDYSVSQRVIDAHDYGVPQRRRRLFMIAVRGRMDGRMDELWNLPSVKRLSAASVLATVARLSSRDDPLNRHRQSSPLTYRRIRSIPINGSRFDLPEELRLRCHRDVIGRAAAAAYGRIATTGPAPTLTTRCTTPACGRFIHPRANRGLTLREAATLQSFPLNYAFAGTYGEIERQIGNAVPAPMVSVIAGRALKLIQHSETTS